MKIADLRPRTIRPLGPWPVAPVQRIRDETPEQRKERQRAYNRQKYLTRAKEISEKSNRNRREKRMREGATLDTGKKEAR